MARFSNHQTETTDMDEYSFGNGLALQGKLNSLLLVLFIVSFIQVANFTLPLQ